MDWQHHLPSNLIYGQINPQLPVNETLVGVWWLFTSSFIQSGYIIYSQPQKWEQVGLAVYSFGRKLDQLYLNQCTQLFGL